MSSRRQRRPNAMRRRLRQRIRHTITHRHRTANRRLTQAIHRTTQNRRISSGGGISLIPAKATNTNTSRVQPSYEIGTKRSTEFGPVSGTGRRAANRMTRTRHRLKRYVAPIVEHLTHQINAGCSTRRKRRHTSRRGRQERAELRSTSARRIDGRASQPAK